MATCMIVDDEPLSRDILRKYIAETGDLELVAECQDAFEAIHQLGRKQVDLLFLDINMPGLTGISISTVPGYQYARADRDINGPFTEGSSADHLYHGISPVCRGRI